MRRRRRLGLSDATPRERWLGQSVKRTLKLYPSCRLTALDLFNEGWLVAREQLLDGETFKRAHRRAEDAMQRAAFGQLVPVSGDHKEIRKLRFVPELHPDYPGRAPATYSRRITPGQWRQLKATMRRVLAPRQAHVLIRMVCEHASLAEVAMEMKLEDSDVQNLRSRAMRRMLRFTAAA